MGGRPRYKPTIFNQTFFASSIVGPIPLYHEADFECPSAWRTCLLQFLVPEIDLNEEKIIRCWSLASRRCCQYVDLRIDEQLTKQQCTLQLITREVLQMDNLHRMLQQKGLQVLDLASPSYLPGHLIKIHYFWRFGDFGAETQLLEDRGLATSLLKIPDLALSPRVPSDLFLQNVTDQFQISAGAGLPQFGLTAKADIQRGVTVTWNISGIETISFGSNDIQTYFQTVLPNLRQFAKSDPRNNGWIQECYLLKQVFFAQTVSGTVHTSGTVDGQGAFTEAGINASGNLALSWSADRTSFVVQGSNEVPFAARGDALG
jgi:hypothetical protein